jgi:hypothetical protein
MPIAAPLRHTSFLRSPPLIRPPSHACVSSARIVSLASVDCLHCVRPISGAARSLPRPHFLRRNRSVSTALAVHSPRAPSRRAWPRAFGSHRRPHHVVVCACTHRCPCVHRFSIPPFSCSVSVCLYLSVFTLLSPSLFSFATRPLSSSVAACVWLSPPSSSRRRVRVHAQAQTGRAREANGRNSDTSVRYLSDSFACRVAHAL